MPSETYQLFIAKVRDFLATHAVSGLLEWDQETYMPEKGEASRAAQIALLAGIAHERLTSDEFARLLHAVEAEADDDPFVAANVREMRRTYDRKCKLPNALVRDIAAAVVLAKGAWTRARAESKFALFAPHLEKLLDLQRQVAEHIGYEAEPYDALLDEYEPGARAADVQQVFDQVRDDLVPLVQAITSAPRQPDTALLEHECPLAAQADFGRHIVEQMTFRFDAGRIDVTTHPFCSGFAPDDVRLTTRYDARYLPMALFGLMHEAGHGLYEQGLDNRHLYTPVGSSASLGIHESQSRMWENMIGRSRPFWSRYYRDLQHHFPVFENVPVEDWYFAINTVRPSLIRVEADEVTYNLHIMLRFDLERQMVRGKLRVKDVPEAWNAAFQDSLHIVPPNDAEGCLQDIHWSMGMFGYFPTYALGNLYAAQFFQKATQEITDLDVHIARGNLGILREWLRENIHQHGQRYRAGELVKLVTGKPLSHKPFIEYLTRKYKPLYGF